MLLVANMLDDSVSVLALKGLKVSVTLSVPDEPYGVVDTPSLRGIYATAPYLHDGSAATLRAVLIAKNAKASGQ